MSSRPDLPLATPPMRRPQRGLLTLLLIIAVGVVAGGLAAAGAVVAWLSSDLPALDKVTDYRPHLPLKVVTRDGVEIAQFGAERRLYLPLERIPRRLQDAVIATEDARFREHTGLDLRGIARAVVSNVFAGRREGASTLTQQVARNFFLSHRRTWERKAKEALLALKIERELSKDEILELYLNQMYLGQRAYGVGAAAQVYYGKSVDQLSDAEMAMIAGLHQNPVYANPITNLERAVERQRWVLQRMKATGVISEAEHQAALAEKPQVRSLLDVPVHAEHVAEMARQAVVERLGTDAAYTQGITVVTSLVAAEQQAAHLALRRALLAHEARQPWRGPEDQEDLPASLPTDSPELEKAAAQALRTHRDDEDLRAAIVLEASPQALVAQLATGEVVRVVGEGLAAGRPGLDPKARPALALRRGAIVRLQWLPEGTARGGLATPSAPVIVGPAPAVAPPKPRVLRREETKGRWWLVQWPQAQGAVAALEPDTGRVRALVGGFDFGRSQFNHATQAWRQPGSSFKPFLYSAALESGVMPQSVVMDAPVTDAQGAPIPGWDPKNSDGQFDGPMTLRQALARSKNSVSIRLVQWMGVAEARAWTAQFGFDPQKQPDNLTLALGAGATTPLQLASAYAVIANGGLRTEPRVVERITDARGAVLFEAPPPPPADESRRVVPARNAWLTAQLLQEVTRNGTAARAQGTLKRGDLYGKTGTTDDAVDAWFGGFQPGIAAAVWLGYPEPRSLGARESGGGLALPVWIELMGTALRGVPVRELPPPDGVVPVDGDWRFEEWAHGGFVARLGVDDAGQPLPVAAGRGAALAASAPEAPPVAASEPAAR